GLLGLLWLRRLLLLRRCSIGLVTVIVISRAVAFLYAVENCASDLGVHIFQRTQSLASILPAGFTAPYDQQRCVCPGRKDGRVCHRHQRRAINDHTIKQPRNTLQKLPEALTVKQL